MPRVAFHNATAILPDGLLDDAVVVIDGDRIVEVTTGKPPADAELIYVEGAYIAPGFVDLHVHGGADADFMDGTPEAFLTVCRAHARHGTTSMTPTSTVANHDQTLRFIQLCQRFVHEPTGGSRVL